MNVTSMKNRHINPNIDEANCPAARLGASRPEGAARHAARIHALSFIYHKLITPPYPIYYQLTIRYISNLAVSAISLSCLCTRALPQAENGFGLFPDGSLGCFCCISHTRNQFNLFPDQIGFCRMRVILTTATVANVSIVTSPICPMWLHDDEWRH